MDAQNAQTERSGDGATPAPNRLGRFVKEQRQARGLSGQALATAAGVDKAWLHRLEGGAITSPDPRLLVRLARALEIGAADLYIEAGFAPGTKLPSMRPYLRAKFDLPEEAIQQIESYVDLIAEHYAKEEDDDERPAPAA